MDGAAPGDLYERDFYAWTQEKAARLRALGPRNDGVDVENVAEEIEGLGKSARSAVRTGPIRAALGEADQPYFDLDAEVLAEDWFPAPPAA
jgi:hypothetical protein